MKIISTRWVFKQNLDPIKKLILLAVVEFSDEEGRWSKSIASLTEITGLCERSVRTHLAELESAGLIRRDALTDFSGARIGTRIVVLTDEDGAAAHATPHRQEMPPPVAGDAVAPPPPAGDATPCRQQMPPLARVENNIININTSKNSEEDNNIGEKKGGVGERKTPENLTGDMTEAMNRYNTLARRIGIPECRVWNNSRRRSLNLRLKEIGGLDGWDRALRELERSSFCRGQNDQGWRASFDFMLQPKSLAKLIEGAYSDHRPMPRRRPGL